MFAHNLAIHLTAYRVVNLLMPPVERILNGQHAIFNLALLHRHRYLFKMGIVNLYLGPSGKIFFQRLMTIRTMTPCLPTGWARPVAPFLNVPGHTVLLPVPGSPPSRAS